MNAVPHDLDDLIVRPDRSDPAEYPPFKLRVMHPEFEEKGNGRYSLGSLGEWRHLFQEGSVINGLAVYDYLLEDRRRLANCLSIHDLDAIELKGPKKFQEFFGHRFVIAMKSVFMGVRKDLLAPCLYLVGGRLRRRGMELDSEWSFRYAVLRYRPGVEIFKPVYGVVRPNRTDFPRLPDGIVEFRYRRLQKKGPCPYRAGDLQEWADKEALKTLTTKKTILRQKQEVMEGFLNIADIEAIRLKGADVFYEIWGERTLVGLKSVALSRTGEILVPCLYRWGDNLIEEWITVDSIRDPQYNVLCYPKGWTSSTPAL
jgi:hypothetical protein